MCMSGYHKNEVFTTPVQIEEALLAIIMEECISIREKCTYKVKGSMHKRARACVRENKGHIYTLSPNFFYTNLSPPCINKIRRLFECYPYM